MSTRRRLLQKVGTQLRPAIFAVIMRTVLGAAGAARHVGPAAYLAAVRVVQVRALPALGAGSGAEVAAVEVVEGGDDVHGGPGRTHPDAVDGVDEEFEAVRVKEPQDQPHGPRRREGHDQHVHVHLEQDVQVLGHHVGRQVCHDEYDLCEGGDWQLRGRWGRGGGGSGEEGQGMGLKAWGSGVLCRGSPKAEATEQQPQQWRRLAIYQRGKRAQNECLRAVRAHTRLSSSTAESALYNRPARTPPTRPRVYLKRPSRLQCFDRFHRRATFQPCEVVPLHAPVQTPV